MAWFKRLLAGGLAALLLPLPGLAQDLAPPPPRAFDAGRLPLAGGGQVPWTVPGAPCVRMNASRATEAIEFRARNAFRCFHLDAYCSSGHGSPGGAFGFSYQRQWFGGGLAAGRLAPGSGVEQDVTGASLRLVGDQDTLLPQLAIGMQYKVSADPEVIRALGGRDAAATDAHVSATKLFLAGGLLLNATLRFARADRQDGYRPQFGASAAWLATRQLTLGAWSVSRNLSLVLAYADLRGIANRGRQSGLHLSLQAGF